MGRPDLEGAVLIMLQSCAITDSFLRFFWASQSTSQLQRPLLFVP